MKILVIHQLDNRRMQYERGIDHDRHEVVYIGKAERVNDLPADLRCSRIVIGDDEKLPGAVIARVKPEDGFDAVLALTEYAILEAHAVREHLGLTGDSLQMLERVRDKVAMKLAVAARGVPIPRFVQTVDASGSLPWTGRTVLKPRRGGASEGVRIFDTASSALAAHQASENKADLEFEEFVDGEILHADGLVVDGKLEQVVVSRYVGKPVAYAAGEPLGSVQQPFDVARQQFAEDVVNALEIRNGIIHLEFFETPDGRRVFLEIANRMGGAGVSDAHVRHTGVHLPSHEIAIRLGLPRPAVAEPSGSHHAWLVFPGHHLRDGSVWDIDVPEHVRASPCLDELHVNPDDSAWTAAVSYNEWSNPVFIEASHEDPDELARFLHTCVSDISIGKAPR